MYAITSYRTSISEMDGMGILHHTNYGKLFERGRIEFLRMIGINYSVISKKDIHFPVLRMECLYRESVEFDQYLAIETFLHTITKTRVSFSYNLFKVDSQLKDTFKEKSLENLSPCAKGYTEHCCLSPNKRPEKFPTDIFEKLKKYAPKTTPSKRL